MITQLPSPPINAIPTGLLALLGIKNGGRYPRDLDTTLGVQLDLLELYARAQSSPYQTNNESLVANTGNASTEITATTPTDLVGGAGALVTPADELWYVFDVNTQYSFTANAGQSIEATMFWQTAGAGGSFAMHPPVTRQGFNTSDALITRRGCTSWDRGYFVPPGSNIRQRHFGALVPAGTVAYFSGFRLLRLKI